MAQNSKIRKQRGRAIKWSERDLDDLSVITPDYVDQVREVWERDAPKDVKGLPAANITLEGKP